MVFVSCEHSSHTGNATGRPGRLSSSVGCLLSSVHTDGHNVPGPTLGRGFWIGRRGLWGGLWTLLSKPKHGPWRKQAMSWEPAAGREQKGRQPFSDQPQGQGRRWEGRKHSSRVPLGPPLAGSINCPPQTHIPLLSSKKFPATWVPQSSRSWQLRNALHLESMSSTYMTASDSVTLKRAGWASHFPLYNWEDEDDKCQLQFCTAAMCQARQQATYTYFLLTTRWSTS